MTWFKEMPMIINIWLLIIIIISRTINLHKIIIAYILSILTRRIKQKWYTVGPIIGLYRTKLEAERHDITTSALSYDIDK